MLGVMLGVRPSVFAVLNERPSDAGREAEVRSDPSTPTHGTRNDGCEIAHINRRFAAPNHDVADATIDLMTWAVAHCDSATPHDQQGEPSYYRRRTPEDSEIAPSATFEQAFDLLRVADEDRYPAFIRMRGKRYRVRLDVLPDEPA